MIDQVLMWAVFVCAALYGVIKGTRAHNRLRPERVSQPGSALNWAAVAFAAIAAFIFGRSQQ